MAVISTIEARCKDCYKCLRACPVKAISFVGGASKTELHAQVMSERCVLCGTCLRVCPQQAKKVRSELKNVQALLAKKVPLAASLAPSFAGAIRPGQSGRLVAALHRLGFGMVAETAYGAELVANAHLLALDRQPAPLLTSSCPVIVNLIEIYYPELGGHLAAVISPMVAHARYLKKAHPETAVVFIGPCVAKKDEAEKCGEIAAALTFRELADWMAAKDLQLESLEEAAFDGPRPRLAGLFPLDGGLLKTAALSTDLLAEEFRVITGLDKCLEFLSRLRRRPADRTVPRMVEMLACEGGCIAGPGFADFADPSDLDERRLAVLEYVRSRDNPPAATAAPPPPETGPGIELDRTYLDRGTRALEPDEQTIRSILAQTGKRTPEDELNCGACGYGSCREKAQAVFHGFADLQMCMPYMRERAESMSNVILEATPTAVIVVNPRLEIVEMNHGAEKMFKTCAAKVVGGKLAALIDPVNFQRVLETKQTMTASVAYPEYNLATEQTIFFAEKENVIIGSIVDKTEEVRHRGEEAKTKQSVIGRAQEVIDKQMKVAQEIAGLLGETTAETKVLLKKLIELMQKD
ncbi:MAG: [Fe-Fe] hydrogenase large subunit C-terminal domain-containing protein [Bacteroidota bacterium]